jgi:hypothetical protein
LNKKTNMLILAMVIQKINDKLYKKKIRKEN